MARVLLLMALFLLAWPVLALAQPPARPALRTGVMTPCSI